MYPSEMKEFINIRNGQLNREEIIYVTNVNEHPQLVRITYNPWDNSYDMWDREENHFHFSVK